LPKLTKLIKLTKLTKLIKPTSSRWRRSAAAATVGGEDMDER